MSRLAVVTDCVVVLYFGRMSHWIKMIVYSDSQQIETFVLENYYQKIVLALVQSRPGTDLVDNVALLVQAEQMTCWLQVVYQYTERALF